MKYLGIKLLKQLQQSVQPICIFLCSFSERFQAENGGWHEDLDTRAKEVGCVRDAPENSEVLLECYQLLTCALYMLSITTILQNRWGSERFSVPYKIQKSLSHGWVFSRTEKDIFEGLT